MGKYTNPPNDEWTVGDFLDRRSLVKAVAIAAATWKPPLTIGVYGPWGEGKTSTMRMIQRALDSDAADQWSQGHGQQIEDDAIEFAQDIQQQIRKKVIGTVWFDPWRYQFENAPALSLIRQIVHTADKRKWVDGHSRALGFLKGLTATLSEAGARFLTLGKAGGKDLSDSVRAMLIGLGAYAPEMSLADVVQEQYAQAIRDMLPKEPRGERLVVFLDDLDRCQPECVVRTLEALKLTLLNPRCVYILGADDAVVASVVHNHYIRSLPDHDSAGDGAFSGERYMEKIVQLPIRLPSIMDDLADTFVEKLIPEGSRLLMLAGKAKNGDKNEDADENAWEKIRTTLREGLRRNPRQAKRFVMLLEFTLSLAELKREDRAGEQAFTDIDIPLLVKVQLLQFTWPKIPRNAQTLWKLEELCFPEAKKAAPDVSEDAPAKKDDTSADTLEDCLNRFDIKDLTTQEDLKRFLVQTAPRFKEFQDDRVLNFHLHLAAATAEAPVEPVTESPGVIRPKIFSAEVKEDTDKGELTIVLNENTPIPFVRIDANTFLMGSDEGDDVGYQDERPQHPVTIARGFYMAVFPTTQEQWDEVMQENRSRFRGPKRPVERISWWDACAFCDALSKKTSRKIRLP